MAQTLSCALRVAACAGSFSAESTRLLQAVGLSFADATRRPARLSGGERQRVAIARALTVVRQLADRSRVIYLGEIVEEGRRDPERAKTPLIPDALMTVLG